MNIAATDDIDDGIAIIARFLFFLSLFSFEMVSSTKRVSFGASSFSPLRTFVHIHMTNASVYLYTCTSMSTRERARAYLKIFLNEKERAKLSSFLLKHFSNIVHIFYLNNS